MSTVRRVFLSYAHESPEHIETVRQLWLLLRANGVDARLDLAASAQRQDWPLWMMSQFREADYVLVVASEAYRRRSEGEAAPGEGRGVQFEGAILRELVFADRAKWMPRVLPVILPGGSSGGVPVWLGPAGASTYRVTAWTADGIEDLLRVITAQPAYAEPPLGPVPHLPPATLAGPAPGRLDELGALVGTLGRITEFGAQPGRSEILSLLPPEIRGAIPDAPNARLHLIAIVRTCARFGEHGRQELLAVLRLALPAGDPDVQHAIRLVEKAAMFV